MGHQLNEWKEYQGGGVVEVVGHNIGQTPHHVVSYYI